MQCSVVQYIENVYYLLVHEVEVSPHLAVDFLSLGNPLLELPGKEIAIFIGTLNTNICLKT